MKAFDSHPIRNSVVCSVYTRGYPSAESVNSAVVDQLYKVASAKQCSRYLADGSIEVPHYSGVSAEVPFLRDSDMLHYHCRCFLVA